MGPDLTDKRWIVAKGILFAVLALLAGALQILAEESLWQETLLLGICVWASCRFYYFLFHCLQAYVDPGLKSAGVMDLVGRLFLRNRGMFSGIKRVDELDHHSEGWPSITESRARILRLTFCIVAILVTLTAIVLPAVATWLAFEKYDRPLPFRWIAKDMGLHLLSTVFVLLLLVLISYSVFFKKRIPFWIMLMGLMGAFGMPWFGGEMFHEFGHVIFRSCSAYYEFIFWISISLACLVFAIWLLGFRVVRGWHVRIHVTKRLALSVISVFVCWLAALCFSAIF